MKKIENFKSYQILNPKAITGGDWESIISFLRNANKWSRAQAIECIMLSEKYACTP